MFLILMVIGLVGLLMMALPALSGHGHAPPTHSLGDGHAGDLPALGMHGGHAHAAAGGGPAPGTNGQLSTAHDLDAAGATRFIPSPRAVFSVLALYGAFGNALVQVAHLPWVAAALLAVVPALAVERLVVARLWNALLRAQGKPSSPLEALLFSEARAVTPFRNGRGLVAVVRDGRLIQLRARLRDDQTAMPVRVGDKLHVEDVDAAKERLTVSLYRDG